ncbi:unnamed protein product [Pedinophyceae sp. YPF-701]|nr:unnamed protein product [Pedinophyceae sp. YPF-701]
MRNSSCSRAWSSPALWHWAHSCPNCSGTADRSGNSRHQKIVARHEAALLRRTYESMHAEFASSGLDIPAIERSQPNFHSGTDAGSNDPREVPTRWPAKYERMSPPYPPNAVRLVVAPIQPNNAAMASILANATAQVLRALPPSTPLYINPTSKLHVTAFFMSEPHDTRPDPLQPGGGCALSLPVRQRPAPTEDAVAREVAVVRHLAADTPATRLRLERIVLARSGCLLATWTEVAEGLPLAQFKAACREAFAGAPPRSPRIYHSTLVRLLTSRQFSEAERKRVVDVCESLTEKLRGREIDVGLLWLCIEQEWSNLEGPTRVIKMQV